MTPIKVKVHFFLLQILENILYGLSASPKGSSHGKNTGPKPRSHGFAKLSKSLLCSEYDGQEILDMLGDKLCPTFFPAGQDCTLPLNPGQYGSYVGGPLDIVLPEIPAIIGKESMVFILHFLVKSSMKNLQNIAAFWQTSQGDTVHKLNYRSL